MTVRLIEHHEAELLLRDVEFCADVDRVFEGACDGTVVLVRRMCSLGGLALVRSKLEMVVDENPLDDEDLVLGLHLPSASALSRPSPAGIWRASSAPPKVPVSQPAAAATT